MRRQAGSLGVIRPAVRSHGQRRRTSCAGFAYERIAGILHSLTSAGRDPFQEWLDRLRDLDGRVAILRRVERLKSGNAGDCRPCRGGVYELRIDVGPGYRVYLARDSNVFILLCGGDKRTQARDIAAAVRCWDGYREG